MIPLSAAWAGPDRNEHLDTPPLLIGTTEGSTPFRLLLHIGDVGHTLVIGPTGAGKSVLLALIALQFRPYAQNQNFALNFGGSMRVAALAMDGSGMGQDHFEGANVDAERYRSCALVCTLAAVLDQLGTIEVADLLFPEVALQCRECRRLGLRRGGFPTAHISAI